MLADPDRLRAAPWAATAAGLPGGNWHYSIATISTVGGIGMKKLSPHALGAAVAVVWAAYVLGCGFMAMLGWGAAMVHVLASLYIG